MNKIKTYIINNNIFKCYNNILMNGKQTFVLIITIIF